VKNSITATTNLPNVDDIVAMMQLALIGHVVRLDANTPAQQALKKLSMLSPDTDLAPSGRDLLDNHATAGFSRSATDHCQESDSPGQLSRITVIIDHCYKPLLCMYYDDDDDGTICTVFLISVFWIFLYSKIL